MLPPNWMNAGQNLIGFLRSLVSGQGSSVPVSSTNYVGRNVKPQPVAPLTPNNYWRATPDGTKVKGKNKGEGAYNPSFMLPTTTQPPLVYPKAPVNPKRYERKGSNSHRTATNYRFVNPDPQDKKGSK